MKKATMIDNLIKMLGFYDGIVIKFARYCDNHNAIECEKYYNKLLKKILAG